VHNENPAEKLNYHGNLNATTNPLKGANFGYPSCVPAWDPNNLGQSGLKVGSLFKPDGVPNASDCASRQPGTLHFHAHTAPLDVKFNANGTSAYIAFHGSWYVPSSFSEIFSLRCKACFSFFSPLSRVLSLTNLFP